MRFYIRDPFLYGDGTSNPTRPWVEFPLLKVRSCDRWMNHKVGVAHLTFLNPHDALFNTFKNYMGFEIKLTSDQGDELWRGQVTNFASIDRVQVEVVAQQWSHRLKRKRFTHNYLMANGIASTAPTGGSADTLTDAHQAFTVDAFNTKGLLVRPSARQQTETIKISATYDNVRLYYRDVDSKYLVIAPTLVMDKDTSGHGVMFLRFPLNIPKAATIDSAILRFTDAETNANEHTSDIYLCHRRGDARPIRVTQGLLYSSTAQLGVDSGVSAVAWTIGATTLNATTDTPDVKTLVQHFTQERGYREGNYIGFFIESDEEDTDANKKFWGAVVDAYTSGATLGIVTTDDTKFAQLIITWTSELTGKWYTIDDTTATTLVCTDDDLEADGVGADDPYYVGEEDDIICEDVIQFCALLTPSVKSTSTYSAIFFLNRYCWDILMDYQLKLGYDLWESNDDDHTINFTDVHVASGLTLDLSLPHEHVKKLYNSDEYYTRCIVVGATYSPIFTVTSVDGTNGRWFECTGDFNPGELVGRVAIPVTNGSGGNSAVGFRYKILGNTENRIIVEKGQDMNTDGLGANDEVLIEHGGYLMHVADTQDARGLGKDFLLEDPGIFTQAEAETYADQIISDLGGDITPLVEWEMENYFPSVDVGKTVVLNFDEFSSATYVCTRVAYNQAPGKKLMTTYWFVKE